MALSLKLPKVNTGLFTFGTRTNRTERAVPSFDTWLSEVTPSYDWQPLHLCEIRRQLKRITDGKIDRLMIFCPPRHGKSQMTTIRYPVWRLAKEPGLPVILGCYNQTLANRFSRTARKIAATQVTLDPERTAVEEWLTTAGGGVRAVGVGAGITGTGAKLIMIDDPVKNRDEAESVTYRDRVWDWYTDDLFTRREPGGAMVLIMTRWHEDDLAGRILASEDGPNWTVVNLPALAEDNDPLGREPGVALWPERYDVASLTQIRTVLGTYSFSALYQQSPVPPGGGMFHREWFDVVGAAPVEASRCRYWDKAATADGDYSVGTKIARDREGVFYIEDVVRGQWSPLARERIMRQTAEMDGGDVTVGVEQEPGSGGLESAQNSVRNLAGFAVYAEKVTGEKQVRAMPFAAQCEARNVKLVRGAWNAAYLDELCAFPYGSHDDQVDSSSGAFARLVGGLGLGMAWEDD
jgi:predicted phage terminase large subunit-like protein